LNTYAERINKRRIEVGVSCEQVTNVMGWNGRYTYYNKIGTITSVWHFQEICKLLNLLECNYDELFRGVNFEDKIIHTYRIRNNPTQKLKEIASKQYKKLPDLQRALGTTRQNYYACLSNRKLKIYQINNLLDLLNCKFEDIFAIKSFYKVVDKKEKEVTVYV